MKGRTSQRCWTVTPDGRSCLLETYQRVLMSPQGENIGLLGISHDVTDWYNMQRQLREEMENAVTPKWHWHSAIRFYKTS